MWTSLPIQFDDLGAEGTNGVLMIFLIHGEDQRSGSNCYFTPDQSIPEHPRNTHPALELFSAEEELFHL